MSVLFVLETFVFALVTTADHISIAHKRSLIMICTVRYPVCYLTPLWMIKGAVHIERWLGVKKGIFIMLTCFVVIGPIRSVKWHVAEFTRITWIQRSVHVAFVIYQTVVSCQCPAKCISVCIAVQTRLSSFTGPVQVARAFDKTIIRLHRKRNLA